MIQLFLHKESPRAPKDQRALAFCGLIGLVLLGFMFWGARSLWGTLLALLASVTGAAIVYRFGCTLLAGILQRRSGARLARRQTRFAHNAFWWVLYMRFFPLSNATLAGLVCGACRIPVGAYLAGSLLGFIPLIIVLTLLGSGGIKGNFYQIAIGIGLLLLAVGVRKLLAPAFRPPEVRDAAEQPEMRS
jgi:uncharacterized membrane protein YdjX (TVP38/TMEM64 family)